MRAVCPCRELKKGKTITIQKSRSHTTTNIQNKHIQTRKVTAYQQIGDRQSYHIFKGKHIKSQTKIKKNKKCIKNLRNQQM